MWAGSRRRSRRSSRSSRGQRRRPPRRTARKTVHPKSPPTRKVRLSMAVTLPEGGLQTRLERYLEGFRNQHGLEESEIEGNLVRVVIEPRNLPAVLTTARERLGVLHLSF